MNINTKAKATKYMEGITIEFFKLHALLNYFYIKFDQNKLHLLFSNFQTYTLKLFRIIFKSVSLLFSQGRSVCSSRPITVTGLASPRMS